MNIHVQFGFNHICSFPLEQLKANCPGMIIGMSFTKVLFFMPIGNPRWLPPQDID
jgi:predicted RND superfamily exporter protein